MFSFFCFIQNKGYEIALISRDRFDDETELRYLTPLVN